MVTHVDGPTDDLTPTLALSGHTLVLGVVRSTQSAVSAFRLGGFSGPPPEPGVRR